MITLHSTQVDGKTKAKLLAAVEAVIDSGSFILGSKVAELEEALTLDQQAQCITCASGTDALYLMLKAAGIGPGSKIFTPAFGFMATPEAIIRTGASPVFVDVSLQTACIDPQSLADALRFFDANQHDAILAVDMFGTPAPYLFVSQLASGFGCRLFSDRAQSFGACLTFKAIESTAAFATSFFPTKPFGGFGDGGALFSRDESILSKAATLRLHGRSLRSKYVATDHGINSRLDAIHAAMLLESLPSVYDNVARRRLIAKRYYARLSRLPWVSCLAFNPNSAFAIFPILTSHRQTLSEYLASLHIETAIYYPVPLPHMPAFSPCYSTSIDNSIELCNSVLAIPMHHNLSDEQVQHVIQSIHSFFGHQS